MTLTWAQILSDNSPPPPPTPPVDSGIYPYGINGYSWELGGDEWLGDPTRFPPPTWTGMTVWFIIYQEAVALHGAAKPTVACTVSIKNMASWIHFTAGGWAQSQICPPNVVTTSQLTPDQQSSTGNPTVTLNGDGSSSWPSAPAGSINHGWPFDRGSFAAGTVDGCFGIFDLKVSAAGANLIAASGIDWWITPLASPNTGYSQSIWKRLGTNYVTFTGTSLSEAILIADPPPPLVGVVPGSVDFSTIGSFIFNK